jgi:hypothetical protein
VYCHGNGRTGGTARHDMPRPDCNGCHNWIALGGEHLRHFGRLIGCTSCHHATTDAAQMTADPVHHVNGTIDVVFDTPDMAFQGGTCKGTCHNERHRDRRW